MCGHHYGYCNCIPPTRSRVMYGRHLVMSIADKLDAKSLPLGGLGAPVFTMPTTPDAVLLRGDRMSNRHIIRSSTGCEWHAH